MLLIHNRATVILQTTVFVATLILGGSLFVTSAYLSEFYSPENLKALLPLLIHFRTQWFDTLLGCVLLPTTVYCYWRREVIIYIMVGAVWFYLSVFWVQNYFVTTEKQIMDMIKMVMVSGDGSSGSNTGGGSSCDGSGGGSGTEAGFGLGPGNPYGGAEDLAHRDMALQQFVLLCVCRTLMSALVALFLSMAAIYDRHRSSRGDHDCDTCCCCHNDADADANGKRYDHNVLIREPNQEQEQEQDQEPDQEQEQEQEDASGDHKKHE